MSFILIIIGFVLLVKCADWFVEGSSNIAKALRIPALIVGLTIVALGTSAPEAAVSITTSVKGMNDISLGNVVGSNISNLLLVLGFSGLFGTLTAKKKVMTRDFRFLIFSSVILLIFTFVFYMSGEKTGIITRINGLMLLGFLGLYLYVLIGDAIKAINKNEEKIKFNVKDILLMIVGLIGIIIGGQLVVNSATDIANMFNISERIIGLTIVAIGTSLPEIVTSIVAVKKGESDIAIGNVVGSNIFNILFVLGLSSAISPITFGIGSFIDVIVMVVATIAVYTILKKHNQLDKKRGLILLLMYVLYIVYILIRL